MLLLWRWWRLVRAAKRTDNFDLLMVDLADWEATVELAESPEAADVAAALEEYEGAIRG